MASVSGDNKKESELKLKLKLKLYSYWKSSCSFRVRIALNFKGLKYESKAVNLLKGEQLSPEFATLNPIGYVPVLVDRDFGAFRFFCHLTVFRRKVPPPPSFVTSGSSQKIHQFPGCQYCFLKHIASSKSSCTALERLLKDYAGRFATGDEVFLADLFLVPQIHSAIKTFKMDMTQFPVLSRLNEAYNEIPAFQDAMPEKQPDTPLTSAS